MENANTTTGNNERPNPPRRTLGDYAMYQGPRHYSSIVIPHTERTIEIKLAYLDVVSAHQFSMKDYEDPYAHLDNFYELVTTMGYNDVEREVAYMMLFPFSLLGEAREWLKSHPSQSLTSWSDLESKFLTRFFPPSRYVHAKFQISTFRQGADESFYEVWERFQMLLRKCSNHGFEDIDQLNIFCNGLNPDTKMILDAAAGGTMMVVDTEQAIRIIIALSSTDRQAQHNQRSVQKRGVLDLNTSDAILAQNKILTQQIEALKKQMSKLPQQLNVVQPGPTQQQVMRCDFCGGDHLTGHYSMPSSNQGWRGNQNQNYGWRPKVGPSNRQPSFQQPFQLDQHPPMHERLTKLEDTLEKFMQVSLTNHKNTEASIRNLETQVGQLAKQMAEQHSDHQHFSANTQTNPKEHCKAITIRSGKVIGKDVGENVAVEEEVLEEKEIEGEKHESGETQDDENANSKDMNKHKEEEKKKSDLPQLKNLPYPKNPSKKDKERQYTRFMDIFKNLQINIHFMEAMEQMLTYAKFMKDLLTRKRKFSEETVTLEVGRSAIIQKSLPEKTKDPGSFTIPVTIGELSVRKALLDLGASINLMPLSMLKRIGDLEIKPMRMTLQLADRSMKFPYGIAEDILVKVDKLVFPVDFAIMDIKEDEEVPPILGRPFMKIARVNIDVDEGKLKVRGQDDEVNFNVFEAIHPPKDKQHCFRVDVGEELYMNDTHLYKSSLLEKALMVAPEGINAEDDNSIETCVAELGVYREVSSQHVQTEEQLFITRGRTRLIEVLKTNDGAIKLPDPASQMSPEDFTVQYPWPGVRPTFLGEAGDGGPSGSDADDDEEEVMW
ncbi:PREDICTED: uncharacterized protein LOC109354835 [Lupinus angustifolius]|uniref:uncharacterized protein LOC109354835 n=1 Tax=Lupinus angustifolius TaxID=3871 RepID=UPI00092F071F|nr:PREDICTED: uncharacterized protein LOC109354835 [Lupinus angustifolius]